MSAVGGGALDLSALKEAADRRRKEEAILATGAVRKVAPFVAITPENFEDDVVRRSLQVPVIVLISSASDPASEQLRTDFEDLARAGQLGFVVAWADADTQPEVAQALGVQSLPTTLVLAAGRPLTQFAGVQPKEALQQFVDTVVRQVGSQLEGLPEGTVMAEPGEDAAPPQDPRLGQAADALAVGAYDAAIAIYDDILASDPKNAEAKQARVQASLLARLAQDGATQDPIAAAAADPDDVDKQLAAADALLGSGRAEDAFALLIDALRTRAGKEQTILKDRLLELFELLGNADPRVRDARRALASALF